MKRRLILLALIGAVAPAFASATPADPFGPRNALHLPPLALHAYGGVVEYERYALPERGLSVAVRAGARQAARGDFAGLGLTAGAELRLWPAQRFVAFKPAPRVMAGPYLAVSLDLAGSGLRNRSEGRVGHTFTLGVSTLAGYRLCTGFGLVGTIYGGFLFHRSWLTGSTTTNLGAIRPTWGFTLGWLF